GEGARARQAVLVYAQAQVAVRAARVGGQHSGVGVAHRFAVLGGAPRMPVEVALASAIPQRGGEPKVVSRAGGRGAGARDRKIEQRVDPRGLVGVVLERGGPPDVGARLERG